MNPLSVVLLGPPSSGKSALLGALEQAGKTPASLGGQLIDVTGQLRSIGAMARDGKLKPTAEEVGAYPIEIAEAGHNEAVEIHDTSGVKAQAVLAGTESLDADDPLPRTLAKADGVVVLVDITRPLDPQVKQVVSFLKTLEDRRSAGTEIAGLPLFVVLTKCDQLPVPKDRTWMQQVEEAKRKAGDYFRKKLAETEGRAFGRLDVRVWATATRRPDGDDKRATTPYQVAELFRQTFDAAREFRRRGERSRSLLETSLMGLGAVTFFLAAAVVWRLATEPTPAVAALAERVASVTGAAANPAEKVREPLEDRLKELDAIEADPAFGSLPSKTQAEVRSIRAEVDAYRQLDKEFRAKVKNPRLATKVGELDGIEKALRDFDLTKWPDTRLAKRKAEWLADVDVLRRAVTDEVAWMTKQIADGEKLREEGGLVIAKQVDAARRESWFGRVNEYLFQGRRHRGNDRIPESTVPYRVVYQFDRVETAERDWKQFKDRLDKLRDEAK